MDKIHVSYDITSLGLYFSRTDSNTGIYRVTQELLYAIAKSDKINIFLTGVCGENDAFINAGCAEYWRLAASRFDDINCSVRFLSTYESRLKIKRFYKAIYKRYFSVDFQKKNKLSLESFAVRIPLKLVELSQLTLFDTYKTFDYTNNLDIFHSTYYALPPKDLTKNLSRLLMVHDLIPIKATEFVSKGLDTYFYKILNSIDVKTDWIVCNSEFTRQEFCEYTNFPLEKTFVTPLGADRHFSPVQDQSIIHSSKGKYHIPDEPYFLCLASQLEPRKNILHLIESFIQLIRENPSITVNLVLAGSLRYRRNDLEKAKQIYPEFGRRVILTGYVSDDDLVPLYCGAVAFIFPSLYEGFGMPVLEAMQTGVPVISSNATSLPEVAGDAAILVDPKNKDSLCQAMFEVLNDQQLRQEMIRKGFEQASKFSWEKCAEQTIDIYKIMLANR